VVESSIILINNIMKENTKASAKKLPVKAVVKPTVTKSAVPQPIKTSVVPKKILPVVEKKAVTKRVFRVKPGKSFA
jgi:hypothetical protein